MGRKQKYEGEAKRVTIQLPLSTIAYYEGMAGSLADGIVEGEKLLRAGQAFTEQTVIGQESKGAHHTRERDVRAESVPTLRSLPPIYKGGEDVTPRFKEKVTRASISPARRPVDSQVVDHGDDDAQPLPAYDF